MIFILIILLLICFAKCIGYYFCFMGVISYLVKNRLPAPTKAEMDKYIKYAVRNTSKDIRNFFKTN